MRLNKLISTALYRREAEETEVNAGGGSDKRPVVLAQKGDHPLHRAKPEQRACNKETREDPLRVDLPLLRLVDPSHGPHSSRHLLPTIFILSREN